MDWKAFEHEHRIMISVAEAMHRGSQCAHVFDWICWRLRWKYPLVRKQDQIINWDVTS